MRSPRQLVKEIKFDEQAKELFGSLKNADVALEGAEIEFSYADDLTLYPLVDDRTGLRAYKSDFVPVADQVIVFFRVEELEEGEQVRLYEVIKALRMSIPWSD